MFFTREDILKIQNALLQLSVKDSELPSAEPVTYDDTLSIVQDGKNKQIKIEDFFNQISLWKREDFINITDKYDEHYISLTEAINLVPILQRKDGLVITFQDIEDNWEIYQFRGNIIEFFNIEKWFNLYDYRNNIIQSIVPDEEDLTVSTPNETGNSLVSLKDRVYDPTSFSGKGYKILRKNIQSVNIAVTKIKVEFSPSSDGTLSFSINGKEIQVVVSVSTDNTTVLVADKIATKLTETMTEYEVSKEASTITLTRKFGGSVTPSLFSASTTGVVCSITDSTKTELRNILTQDMINQPNTIYEIRYDFDLNGENIEMQEGCTLKFEGGKICKGAIKLNKTSINSKPIYIFDNIILSGSITEDILLNWFVKSKNCTLSRENLGCAIHVIGKCEIDEPLLVKSWFNIYGDSMYQTRISLSQNYIGDTRCIFVFDEKPVYWTSFSKFGVSEEDYVFYSNCGTTEKETGSISVSNFKDLYFDSIRKSVFHVIRYGFATSIINNVYFQGESSDNYPMMYFKIGYWNNNTIEKCKANGHYNGLLYVEAENVGEILNTNICNNWFETVTLKGNNALFVIKCKKNLCTLNFSKNYVERIYESEGNILGNLFFISVPVGKIVRQINLTDNIFNNDFKNLIILDANVVGILISGNGALTNQKISASDDSKFLQSVSLLSNTIKISFDGYSTQPNILQMSNQGEIDVIKENITSLNKINNKQYISKIITSNGSITVDISPIKEKALYWNDVLITYGYSTSNLNYLTFKLLTLNGTEFILQQTSEQTSSSLVIEQVEHTSKIKITNNGDSSIEVHIGVLAMVL